MPLRALDESVMQGKRLLTVLVAIGLIVGSVPGGALASAGGGDATEFDSADGAIERVGDSAVTAQTADGNATDGNASAAENDTTRSRATVGQQLATIIAVTDDEVSGDIESSSLEAALAGANDSEQATILSDRAATLRDRADEVVAAQREARVAYEDGNVTRGEFAQRLAVLTGQARTVDRGLERVSDHAADVSTLELRAAGYDRTANADASERLARVTGTGASALLAQYTGESDGEFSLEVDGGVSIEVESDDGERSREFERDQPGNGEFNVTQGEALTAATEPLSTGHDGEWTLRSVDRDGEDGSYEFEFSFFGPETTGEAEVSVDGQTGAVFAFEEAVEPRERDDDGDDADDIPLSISIANGTAEPGATVTLRVTAAGEPVEGATVELNDQGAGTTGADGRIEVTLPAAAELDIDVEDGEREGELEITLGAADADSEADAELRERLSAGGTVENGTVTISVTYDGTDAEGVSVYVDDERVGRTDEDGSLSFDASGVNDELEVTVVKGAFEAEIELAVGADGTLSTASVDFDQRDADDPDADDDSDDGGAESDRDGEEDDRDADELSVAVVSGEVGPGATVTVKVTDAEGEPVEGANVEAEGKSVGTTDADGRIEVTFPADGDEANIDVEDGDREGELEAEFETDSANTDEEGDADDSETDADAGEEDDDDDEEDDDADGEDDE